MADVQDIVEEAIEGKLSTGQLSTPQLSAAEKLKAESHYLRGRIRQDLADGRTTCRRGARSSAEAPRHLSAGRPRAAGRGPAEAVDGPPRRSSIASWSAPRYPAAGSPANSSWPSSTCATKSATPRCASRRGRVCSCTASSRQDLRHTIAPDQRGAAHDAGGLRRREAKRDVLALPVQRRPGSRRDAGPGRRICRAPQAATRTPTTRFGSPMARRARRKWSPARPTASARIGRRKRRRSIPSSRSTADVFAAQVQDRNRPARRQQRRRLCQRRRPAGDLRRLEVVGYNVLVGGGFGVTPSAKKTFPAVALPLCYIDGRATWSIS